MPLAESLILSLQIRKKRDKRFVFSPVKRSKLGDELDSSSVQSIYSALVTMETNHLNVMTQYVTKDYNCRQ